MRKWETRRGGGLDCEEPWRQLCPDTLFSFHRLALSRLLPGDLACSQSQCSCVTSTRSVHPLLPTLLRILLLLRLLCTQWLPPLQWQGFSLHLLPPHRRLEVCLKSLADYVKTHTVLFITVGSFLSSLCFYFNWIWGQGSEENVFNPLKLKLLGQAEDYAFWFKYWWKNGRKG